MRSVEYFRNLTIIHMAMLAGQAIYAAVAYFLVKAGSLDPHQEEMGELFRLVIPLLGLAGILASYFLFRYQVGNIRLLKQLSSRMVAYRTAQMVRYSLLEAPTLFAITGYLLTANLFFFILALLIMTIFLLVRTTRNGLIHDLELNQNEQALIENENSIIP